MIVSKTPRRLRRYVLQLAAAVCVSALGQQKAHADGGYRLGQGYELGDFNLAGYTNVTAGFPDDGRNSLAIEDVSLFVSGHLSRWVNPFVEAELAHMTLVHGGGLKDDPGDAVFVLERYYNDAYLSDDLTLRLGKMLAPVGAWNLFHAAPLVMSATRPAVTYKNYAAYVEGASFLYGDPGGAGPDVQAYWQPDWEETERSRNINFEEHRQTAGLHLSFPLQLLDTLGFSYQYTEDLQGVSQSLFGVDYQYTVDNLTFRGEGTYSRLRPGNVSLRHDNEAGAYVSASYALDTHWSAYSWYEAFRDREATSAAQDVLLGISYRPVAPVVFKVEYLQNVGGAPVSPTGIFASWAVLF